MTTTASETPAQVTSAEPLNAFAWSGESSRPASRCCRRSAMPMVTSYCVATSRMRLAGVARLTISAPGRALGPRPRSWRSLWCRSAMTTRVRLPDRRSAETFELQASGFRIHMHCRPVP